MKLTALKPVARLLAKELVTTVLLLIGISGVVFAVLYLAPGNPFSHILPGEPSAGAANLPRAWYAQYLTWFSHMIRGDLGHSVRTGLPVLAEVVRTGLNALALTGGAMFFSLLLAVPLAVQGARKGRPAITWSLTALTYVDNVSTTGLISSIRRSQHSDE